MGSLENYIGKFIDLSMLYIPKVVLAILTLIIGLKIVGFIANRVEKAMENNGLDDSLRSLS